MPEFSQMSYPPHPNLPKGKRKLTEEHLPYEAEKHALSSLKELEELWKLIGETGGFYKKDWVSKKYFMDLVIEKMKEMNIED